MYDSLYDQSIAAATAQRQQSLAQLAAAQKTTQLRYGYHDSGGIDASNPFSLAYQLREAYKTQRKYNTNSLASQGQLYSGYHKTRQKRAEESYAKSEDALRKAYDQEQGQLAGAATQTTTGFNDAALAALAAFNDRRPPAPVTAPGVQSGNLNGQQLLNSLGGTLVIQGGRRFIRRPDGSLVPFEEAV